MLRRRDLVPVFAGYVDQHLLRVTMSMIELLAGLGLVVHNAWSPLPAAVMTLLGWLAVVEAVFYMAAPRGRRPCGRGRPLSGGFRFRLVVTTNAA